MPPPLPRGSQQKNFRDIRRARRKHHSTKGTSRSALGGRGCEENIENTRKYCSETFSFLVPFPTPFAIRHALSPRPIPPLFGRILGILGAFPCFIETLICPSLFFQLACLGWGLHRIMK